jgi:DNA-binding MarR family transcriptional regulator
MDNNKKVLAALSNALSPLKSGEISEQTGIDKKEVDKAIKSLIKENKVSSPKRCYYQAE